MTARIPEIVLFEDTAGSALGPAALTRPEFELVVGGLTQRARVERLAQRPVRLALIRSYLRPLLGLAKISDFARERASGSRVFLNARWLPDEAAWREVAGLGAGEGLVTPEGEVVAFGHEGDPAEAVRLVERMNPDGARRVGTPWRISPDISSGVAAGPAGLRTKVARGHGVLRKSSDLIAFHERLMAQDVGALADQGGRGAARVAADPQAGVFVRGDQVYAEEGARISGPVVFEAEGGPILLRSGAEVGPFSTLRGPVLVDRGAQVLGGPVAQSYIGPGCRIRGEVSASVFLGWSNKAHEGFVGHSYFGEWVNLGALTTTSNLKNTYGEIRVGPDRQEATGLQKLGSLVGDHTRTAIGSLLASGSLIGAGVNLFGASGVAPHWLPSFVWGVGEGAASYELGRFLEVAERVLARRGRALAHEERAVLAAVHEASADERNEYLKHRP